MEGTHVYFESRNNLLSATLYGDSKIGVVLCPPHPLYGGTRHDTRIVQVARELVLHDITALCIEYGSFGHGISEVEDVLNAVSYFKKTVYSIGLLGYSFGAVVASNAATIAPIKSFVAISILRKVGKLESKLDFNCPKLFIHGRYDDVAPYSDFIKLFAETKEKKELYILNTNHLYMENYPEIIKLATRKIREFFERTLMS